MLVCAALLLRDAPALEGLVVAGIDERVSDERRWTRGTDSGSVEAAAAAVLGRHGQSEPQIIGLGLGASSVAGVVGAIGSACPPGHPGPDLLIIEGGLPDLNAALEQAGFTDIPRIYLAIRLGPLEGSAGPAALALAVEALASGARRVLLLGVGELVGASTLLVAAATAQEWTQRSSP